MQDLSYLDLSIEFYDLAKRIESFMQREFAVEVLLFGSAEQIISASPEELYTYLSALTARLGAYLSVLDNGRQLKSEIQSLTMRLEKFQGIPINNSSLVTPRRQQLVHEILFLFKSTVESVESLGYSGVKPYRKDSLKRLYRKSDGDLEKLRDRAEVLRRVYDFRGRR